MISFVVSPIIGRNLPACEKFDHQVLWIDVNLDSAAVRIPIV